MTCTIYILTPELGFKILQQENGGMNMQMELTLSMIGNILMEGGIGLMKLGGCKPDGNKLAENGIGLEMMVWVICGKDGK